jgi:hypothetical protein
VRPRERTLTAEVRRCESFILSGSNGGILQVCRSSGELGVCSEPMQQRVAVGFIYTDFCTFFCFYRGLCSDPDKALHRQPSGEINIDPSKAIILSGGRARNWGACGELSSVLKLGLGIKKMLNE